MLLSQSAELLMIGQKFVLRSQHPADLQPGYICGQASTGEKWVQCQKLVQSQYENDLTKSEAAEDGVFHGVGVVGLPTASLLETCFFIKSSCSGVRFAHLKKHRITVCFASCR